MLSHRIQPSSLLASLFGERLFWRALTLLLSLLTASVGLFAPYAQKEFTDALLAGRTGMIWVWLAFGALALYHALWQGTTWIAVREGLISQKALADSAFHRLLEGPGGLLGRAPAGVAVSLFAVDITGASALLDQSMLMFGNLLFPLLLAPLALRAIYGIPLWASLGSIATLAFVQFVLAFQQSKYFLAFKQLAAERTGLVSEWVQNIRTIRILGWTAAIEGRIFALRRRETRNRKLMVTNGQIMNTLASSSTFVLNVLAVMLLLRLRGNGASPQPGELLSLLWILGVFLARPLRQLPWMLVMTFDGLSSLERLSNAFRIPIVRPTLSGQVPLEKPAALALEVRGLRIEADGKPILRGVDLALPARSLTAVVGEVGSGKTMLLQSLIGGTGARFDRFAVNGVELAGPLDPRAKDLFSFVPQEGFTISASLRENVVFTYLDDAAALLAYDQAVTESLNLAQFRASQERVGDGLDAEIGERGVNLSGGQRQRVGLARARYADRQIVLLDDCLSAVDVDTERRLIDELILGAWKDHTRLLATHRLAILPLCDEVIFLVDGAVETRGAYLDLLAHSPRFREFVRREDRQVEAEDNLAASGLTSEIVSGLTSELAPTPTPERGNAP